MAPAERAGSGERTRPASRDSRQVFRRLAGCWTYWGWKGGYFTSEADARAFHDETCHMLAAQMAAPNSPQWFNTGLHWAYGIEGPPQGHYFVDPANLTMEKSANAYERRTPHACFIQGVSDDLVNDGGIMDLWVREARIFKYGSGTGSNFSAIRGEGEPLSGGGKSSGLMSFLKIGDRAAGAIKSGGTTRRAAKMVVLDLDHPDIEEFVNWKVVEEQKVAALVSGSRLMNKHLNGILTAVHAHENKADQFDPAKNAALRKAVLDARAALLPENYVARALQLAKQGAKSIHVEEYDTDWTSKAYYTVSGQNSNNSVRITNDFMKAVETTPTGTCTGGRRRRRRPRGPRPQAEEDAQGPRPVGPDRQRRLGVRRPRRAVRHHLQRVAHLPGRRPHQRDQPVQRVYAFFDDTACNLASLNLLRFYDTVGRQVRHRQLQARRAAVDAHPRNQRPHGAVPQRAGGAEVVRLPHPRPGVRQPGRAAHGAGHPLRLARRPGAVWGAHRHHARRGVRGERGDGRRGRPVRPVRGEQGRHAAGGAEPPQGGVQLRPEPSTRG